MPNVFVSSWSSSLRRALGPALVVALLPLGTAFAQSGQFVGERVRVTHDHSTISASRSETGWVVMTAAAGTELEVLDTEGDSYRHLDSNWYLVLLPRDAWGTQRAGWISGRRVEVLPPVEPKTAAAPADEAAVDAAAIQPKPEAPEAAAAAAPVPAASAASVQPAPALSDVVVHFEFGKSDLLDAAKQQLDGGIAALKANGQSVEFALDGFADSTGPEKFNYKLGLARAEAVKQYLVAHEIPADKISVTSYGEDQPAASNDTPEGRAENRRVVLKAQQ